jgi:CRP/FNR family cyclic AMP-dependent transcriptional regulator
LRVSTKSTIPSHHGTTSADGKTSGSLQRAFIDTLPAGCAALMRRAGQVKRYRDGAVVMQRGQAVPGVMVLLSGRMRTLINSASGEVQLLRWLEAGEAVGVASALAQLPFQNDLEASGPCEVLWIPCADFVAALHSDAAAGVAVACMLSVRIAELFDRAAAQSKGLLTDRLRAVLGNLGAANGVQLRNGSLRLRITQSDLADAVSASRQRVNEALRVLQQRGEVRLGYRCIETSFAPRIKGSIGQREQLPKIRAP